MPDPGVSTLPLLVQVGRDAVVRLGREGLVYLRRELLVQSKPQTDTEHTF